MAIFTALSSVFTQSPVIPQQVNFRHESRREFRARATAFFDNDTDSMNRTFTDGIAALISMVWDYDTSDCMTNFSACACRNLVIDEALCDDVRDRHKRGLPVSTGPILSAVAVTMEGSTFCDHHMRFYNGSESWETIWPSDRSYYLECMEKVIQGGRLNDASSVIPADLFYRHEAPLAFWENARKAAIVGAQRQHDQITRQRHSQRMLPDDVFEQRWTQRNAYIQRWARSHPRWKKSLLTAGLIKIDQFEHKFRTGFYMPMVRRALRNIQEGNIPKVSIQERFGILSNHLPTIAKNLIQIQVTPCPHSLFRLFHAHFLTFITISHPPGDSGRQAYPRWSGCHPRSPRNTPNPQSVVHLLGGRREVPRSSSSGCETTGT